MTDTTASARSLRVVTDANKTSFYEAAGAAGDILTLDLTNKRVGVGGASPDQTLKSSKSFGLGTAGNVTLANGRNDNVTIGDTSFVQGIAGPTGAFQISGIVPTGTNGQMLIIMYNGGQVFTINHNDANSTAANRIFCPGNANKVVNAASGAALLLYSSGQPGWQLMFFA
jgi:hypothetical protein